MTLINILCPRLWHDQRDDWRQSNTLGRDHNTAAMAVVAGKSAITHFQYQRYKKIYFGKGKFRMDNPSNKVHFQYSGHPVVRTLYAIKVSVVCKNSPYMIAYV